MVSITKILHRAIFVIVFIPGDTRCSAPFSKSGAFCFFFDQSAGNFTEKRTSCVAVGGYLAKVDSAQKAAALSDFMTCKLFS